MCVDPVLFGVAIVLQATSKADPDNNLQYNEVSIVGAGRKSVYSVGCVCRLPCNIGKSWCSQQSNF